MWAVIFMDDVQRLFTPNVRGKKNLLRILEREQESLKYFVPAEPLHIWSQEEKIMDKKYLLSFR